MTTFHDLIDWVIRDTRRRGYMASRMYADAILAARPDWIDCPTCEGRGCTFDLRCDNCGGSASLPLEMTCSNHLAKPTPCPDCDGTGPPTIAQLLAWGQAVATTTRRESYGDDYDDGWNECLANLRAVKP